MTHPHASHPGGPGPGHPHAGKAGGRPGAPDFDKAPFLLIWEVTQACALACAHCRAEAIDHRHPGELTTEEGKALIRDTAAMGTPILVFTGGDPIQREDLEELIRAAKAEGLRTGTIPAGTPRLTRERLESLRDAGIDQLAFSLDAATAARHDGHRGVEGSFERTLQGARWARELGVPLQINTCFAAWNHDQFDAMAALVEELGVVFWEVFFLVPTGRGAEMQTLGKGPFLELFAKLHALQRRVPFIVKVTEAPYYRVYVTGKEREQAARDMLARPEGIRGSVGQAPLAVNSGKGFCFVGHTGDVYPSGFLPVTCGNVRDTSVIEVYRQHPLFQELRDPDALGGVCGACDHRQLCGGSRSVAFALSGDPLAEDPLCPMV